MTDTSDPALRDTYEDVRGDKSATNWALFTYTDKKQKKLQVGGSGSGGLAELFGKLVRI